MASVVPPFLIVALWAAASLMAAAASRRDFRIIAFGDSFSDTGIVYNVTGGKVPLAPYYWNGRFTNFQGNWQDWINSQNSHGMHATNRAIGGALACRRFGNFTGHFTPTVAEQATMFFYQAFEDPSLLTKWIPVPVIWAGNMDVMEMHNLSPHELARLPLHVAECVVHTAMLLLAGRVPYVVVTTVAPMDLTPLGGGSWFTNSAIWHTNQYIKKGVSDLQAELRKQGNKNQSVLLWDAHDFMVKMISNYTSLGFKHSSSSSCLTYKPGEDLLNGVPSARCFRPDDYIFYDSIHPTSKVHKLLSEDLLKTLARGGVSMTAPTALLYRDRMLEQQQQ